MYKLIICKLIIKKDVINENIYTKGYLKDFLSIVYYFIEIFFIENLYIYYILN